MKGHLPYNRVAISQILALSIQQGPVMAKVTKGRISGVDGMDAHTSFELFAWAAALRAQATDAGNEDDLKWLFRRADRLTVLATAKEKALEHKVLHGRR